MRNQLVDAAKSLHIGWGDDLSAEMGPLSSEPGEKLLAGLTTLDEGQKWVLKPRRLDDTNRLWSPGVRVGVEPGSEYHMVEYFGPILGVMRVDTLEEAIAAQNMVDFGLTAGLHSLDPDEINYWLNNVEAGNVYVNRGITGAIVQRQPFGGWKRSAVGETTKAGGPNYLYGFGDIKPVESASEGERDAAYPPAVEHEANVKAPQLRELLESAKRLLSEEDYARLAVAVESDQHAIDTEFGRLHDPSKVGVERNILRYLPVGAQIRVGKDASLYEVFRAVSAGIALGEIVKVDPDDETSFIRELPAGAYTGMDLTVSTETFLPTDPSIMLGNLGVDILVENKRQFAERVQAEVEAGENLDIRIRMIGEDGDELRRAVDGSIDVAIWDGPVTTCGRVEILPFVREQAVSITNHRFGNKTPLSTQVLV